MKLLRILCGTVQGKDHLCLPGLNILRVQILHSVMVVPEKHQFCMPSGCDDRDSCKCGHHRGPLPGEYSTCASATPVAEIIAIGSWLVNLGQVIEITHTHMREKDRDRDREIEREDR